MKKKPQAKIIYRASEDTFELWIKGVEEKEYDFCRSAKCRKAKDIPDDDYNYIHYSFMIELLRTIELGYDVSGEIENQF